MHGLISSERVRRLNRRPPLHCGEGSVGRSTSFSLSNTRCRRRLISGQRLVTLPQDVHTASWQTLGLGSAAVSVQCSAPTTRFKENMKNKQNCAAKMLNVSHTKGVVLSDLSLYFSGECSSSSQIQNRELKFKKKLKHLQFFL